MGEVMIPPWVRPESPETIRLIDDGTIAFSPAFGRGTTQRGIWADPRWGLHRRYRGLRSDEKAAIQNAWNETRGQFNILRVTPHTPIRGSFATSELLTNNTFANGTTGLTALSPVTGISVSDRTLRISRISNNGTSAMFAYFSGIALTQYASYALRAMTMRGRNPDSVYPSLVAGTSAGSSVNGGSTSSTSFGLLSIGFVAQSASTYFVGVGDTLAMGPMTGDYLNVPYISLAREPLVDNGANLLLRSDVISNASWTKTRSSASGSDTAPDGTALAERIIEDATASNTHFVQQAVTVSSAVGDYCFAVAAKAGTRTFLALQMEEFTGGTVVTSYFNLTTGASGTTSTGANWSNLRTFSVDLGGGWFYLAIVARKTNASTSLTQRIFIASADGTASYTGDGSSFVRAWRATLSQSSLPVRLVQTTTASTTGSGQTGAGLYTKGWPASTSGLLLTGDWVEINGELKQLTAPVNSDAAGMAYMQFRPGLAGAPADNDPVIVYEPFGRFIYPQGTREMSNLFGIYSDCEMDLEEIYA